MKESGMLRKPWLKNSGAKANGMIDFQYKIQLNH